MPPADTKATERQRGLFEGVRAATWPMPCGECRRNSLMPPAVIEGCYADLIEALATEADHLIPRLFEHVRSYPHRDDTLGWRAHNALFESFKGTRERIHSLGS